MKFFRTIVIIARKKDLITKDPYGDYSIKLEEKETVFLTVEEIKNMLSKDFGNERLDQVRDVFVFCCYTGLAYVDVENLPRQKGTGGCCRSIPTRNTTPT